MNEEELILVTGATGFLGMRLVRGLLERQPHVRLALLIRDRAGQSGQQRVDTIVPQAERSRVQVYSGDVGKPGCGLDSAAYQRLSAETVASFTVPPQCDSITLWTRRAMLMSRVPAVYWILPPARVSFEVSPTSALPM